MAKLLNARSDTFVYTKSDPNYKEGLRVLDWNFRGLESPDLSSSWDPWNRKSIIGSLLNNSDGLGYYRTNRYNKFHSILTVRKSLKPNARPRIKIIIFKKLLKNLSSEYLSII